MPTVFFDKISMVVWHTIIFTNLLLYLIFD